MDLALWMVSTLILFGVVYPIFVHKKLGIATAFVLIIGGLAIYDLYHIKAQLNRLKNLELRKQYSSIRAQGSLTNGLYSVLAVTESPFGGYLVVLHPAVILDIDFRNRSLSSTNLAGPAIFVDLDTRLIAPGESGFSGFAEVYTQKVRGEIRDYNPFLHLPEK